VGASLIQNHVLLANAEQADLMVSAGFLDLKKNLLLTPLKCKMAKKFKMAAKNSANNRNHRTSLFLSNKND
jgi:hypothetical protein